MTVAREQGLAPAATHSRSSLPWSRETPDAAIRSIADKRRLRAPCAALPCDAARAPGWRASGSRSLVDLRAQRHVLGRELVVRARRLDRGTGRRGRRADRF